MNEATQQQFYQLVLDTQEYVSTEQAFDYMFADHETAAYMEKHDLTASEMMDVIIILVEIHTYQSIQKKHPQTSQEWKDASKELHRLFALMAKAESA